jgi:hypothetical protein
MVHGRALGMKSFVAAFATIKKVYRLTSRMSTKKALGDQPSTNEVSLFPVIPATPVRYLLRVLANG